MAGKILVGFLAVVLLIMFPIGIPAMEFSADVALEARGFFHSPSFSGQRRHDSSLAFKAEFYHEFPSGSSVIFQPFLRLDSSDSQRSHGDIRELNFLYLADSWEMRLGIDKVFWGATEFVHLVDIINQTDFVEAPDGEEKLGQPMIHFSLPRDWGTVDAFMLPWFRERSYPGRKGRLRPFLPVDQDRAEYESSSAENHLDFALRFSHTLADVDFGLYQFLGTSREPVLMPGLDSNGRMVLIPYYEQMSQTGLDMQMALGNWLWKGEALYRSGQGRSFAATTLGFEYTFVGLADSAMDLGLIGEMVFDDRDSGRTPTIYDNDIMTGLRLAVNDANSTEILLGMIYDFRLESKMIALEASSRVGDNVKVNLESSFFFDMSDKDPIHGLADDDFVKLEIVYYF